MKTTWKILGLACVIGVSFYVAIVKYRAAKELRYPARWNYLVLSFCSLRADAALPNVEKFFSSGFKLENAVNPNPWTTIFHFLKKQRARIGADYEIVGDPRKMYTRIPVRMGAVGEEKDYEGALEGFRESVLRPREKPFLAVAHITYMHYPYLIAANERVETYAREKRADKQPFILAMKGVKDNRAMGMIANPESLARWKKSPGFQDDVKLLREAYFANAGRLDQFVADALNLWGDRRLQKNTAVIFMGDHGEMLMENGELTHATSLYENAVRFPFYMKFPGQRDGLLRVQEQIQMSSIAYLLEALTDGSVRQDAVPEFFRRHAQRYLVLRDCANKVRGLRADNRWKYFVRIADGEKFLFDIEKDPREEKNLAAEMPEKVVELEQAYWANYESFAGLPAKRCAAGD